MGKLQFCELCGELLELKPFTNKTFAICKCGFVKELSKEHLFSEKAPAKEEIGEGAVQEEETPGFPHTCEKCSYEVCEIYDLGAPYGDESNIYLYKCKKCGFVERQADGTGNV